ncbi:hypothetical protein GCM10025880_40920 [Methylorubrum aminovorans]|nr:hypothetical protein GCM10025880_40920 [Methylorubrum aminovorans]
MTRAGHEAQHRGGDDPERSLAADEELLPVVAGIVLAQGAQAVDDAAVGEHDFETEDEVAGHAVAQHVDAAGIGGDHAADHRRAFRGVAHREQPPGGLRCGLRRLYDAARLDFQGEADRIDRADRVHPCEREHDLAPRGVGGGPAREPGMAALGHQRDARLAAQADDGGDLLRARRPRNRGGPAREQAAPVDGEGGAIGLVRQQAARPQPCIEPGEEVGGSPVALMAY